MVFREIPGRPFFKLLISMRDSGTHLIGAGAFSTGGTGAPIAAAGAVTPQPLAVPQAVPQAVLAPQHALAGAQQVRAGLQQRCRSTLQHFCLAGLQQLRASAVPTPKPTTTPNAKTKPNKRLISISFVHVANTKQGIPDIRVTHLLRRLCRLTRNRTRYLMENWDN